MGGSSQNLVIFPCHVLHPSASESVKFFKKVVQKSSIPIIGLPPRKLNFTHIKSPIRILPNTTTSIRLVEVWMEITPNANFHFVPELGWVYNKSVDLFTKLPNSFRLSPGSYKCGMDGDKDDFVTIELKDGLEPQPPSFDEPITSNATLNYTFHQLQRLQVNCCSSSATPPQLFLIDCYNRFTCQHQKIHFSSLVL